MTSEYILNSWRFWKLCHLVPTRALALDSWGITEPPPLPLPPPQKKPTEISLPKKYLDNCYFYGLLYIPVKSVKVLCVSLPCRFVCPYDCLFFSLTVHLHWEIWLVLYVTYLQIICDLVLWCHFPCHPGIILPMPHFSWAWRVPFSWGYLNSRGDLKISQIEGGSWNS